MMSKVYIQVYCATCLAVFFGSDQKNTQKSQSSVKWKRPENTYHVNGVR